MWLAALSRAPLIEEIQAVWVQEIWRYPVKSMAGESLETADLTEAGVSGDRTIQVRNAAGRIMTARTRPLLLRHRATLGTDSLVLVDGVPWISAGVARDVEAAAGAGTRLVQSDQDDASTSCRYWSRPMECSRRLVTTGGASGRIW